MPHPSLRPARVLAPFAAAIVLCCLALPVSAARPNPGGPSTPPVQFGIFPNRSGQVDLARARRWGYEGPLDPRGFQVAWDPKTRTPVFRPGTSPTDLEENQSWESGYSQAGIDGPIFGFIQFQDKLIAGGAFLQAGKAISRYVAAWDGTRWAPMGIGTDFWVVCFAIYQGSLFAGGNFLLADGKLVNYITQWDGNTWVPVGGGMDGPVWALAVHDGKLVAGGFFSQAGGVPAQHLAVWDGTSWSALGGGTDQEVLGLLSRPGELIVAGAFDLVGAQEAHHIASWDGSNWHAFGAGTDGQIVSVAEFGEKLVVGGYFSRAGNNTAANLAAWDGTAWSALGSGTNDGVDRVLVHNGRLLAAGPFSLAGGQAARGVAAWDGTSWSALGNPLDNRGSALAVFNEDLLVSGFFRFAGTGQSDGTPVDYFARLQNDAWQPVLEDRGRGTNDGVNTVAFLNGDLVVAGNFSMAGNIPAHRVARWNGRSWEQMGGGFTDAVFVLKTVNGVLYAGGLFGGTTSGTALNGIARWDGTDWQPMGQGFNRAVFDIEDGYGLLMAAGSMSLSGGTPVNRVCFWDGDSWRSLGGGITGTVRELLPYNGMIYAAGTFTIPDVGAQYLARFNQNRWEKVDNAFDGPATALASYDGKLIVGGYFRVRGLAPIRMVAAWDGAAWSPMGEGFNAPVNTLLLFQGQLVAGGQFDRSGAVTTRGLARWDGTAWQPFGSGVYGPVPEVVVAAGEGDRLVVGGYFNRAGGRVANNLSAWSPYLPTVFQGFSAVRTPRGAVVTWDIEGLPADSPEFDVYRETADYPRIRLTKHTLLGDTHYTFADPDPPHGPASYWIAELDRAGQILWHGPATLSGLPVALMLAQNTPNPFAGGTEFSFETPTAGNVRLAIYDLSGAEVARVLQTSLPSGTFHATWNGKDAEGRPVAGGIYVARLSTAGGQQARKILKIR